MKTVVVLIFCSLLSAAAGYRLGLRQGALNYAHERIDAQGIQPTPDAVTQLSIPAQESDNNRKQLPELQAPTHSTIVDETDPQSSAHEIRAKQEWQTLTDTRGRSIQARVLEVTNETVKIRRQDGLESTIPLSVLNDADIQFCNYLRNREADDPFTTDEFDWTSLFE